MTAYLTEIDKQQREERKETIRAMWLACCTQQEISDQVNLSQPQLVEYIKEVSVLDKRPNPIKLNATYQDESWQPPIYDIWQASVGV